MTVAQLRAYLREHWQRIKAELLAYNYHPQAALKVEIPKLGGKWNVGSSSGRCRHERIGQRSEVGRKFHPATSADGRAGHRLLLGRLERQPSSFRPDLRNSKPCCESGGTKRRDFVSTRIQPKSPT